MEGLTITSSYEHKPMAWETKKDDRPTERVYVVPDDKSLGFITVNVFSDWLNNHKLATVIKDFLNEKNRLMED